MTLRKTAKVGFTLVELLVVVAIITVLVALLIPALAEAKEISRRTACGANMRSLGVCVNFFGTDHSNFVPAGFSYGETGLGQDCVVFPAYINFNPVNDTDTGSGGAVSLWQRYGTSYQLLASYAPQQSINVDLYDSSYNIVGTTGLAKMFVCPSRGITGGPGTLGAINGANIYGYWGSYTGTTYQYVGGIANHVAPWNYTTYSSAFNFGNTPPPMRTTESVDSVLAADMVYWGGAPNVGLYTINHPNRNNSNVAEFQNLLYLDGHVDGISNPTYKNIATYARSRSLTNINYAVLCDPYYSAGYFYWPQ